MKTKIFFSAAALSLAAGFTACQDDWDDHYDQQADTQYGSASIYEIIASRPELSDFKEVLDAARLFANNRITSTRYSDLLNADQFVTVWAPVNGTFNKDSLLQMCQTVHGDSLVELHFLKNHIARYAHSAVAGENQRFLALNNKSLSLEGMNYGDARISEANIASRNGVLHILNQPATYRYNIFEALFSLPEYQHVGNFLQSYQIDEFDEVSSLPMGIVDGKTVYADSVFYSYNKLLLNYYGDFSHEDSTYWMLVPDKTVWDSLYAEASTYYQFGNVNKTDSLHDFWTNYALLQDLVYNPKVQRSINDSLCSTAYTEYYGGRYHVYYNPFAANGLMSHVSDSLPCSNGTLYQLRDWPFLKEKTYFTEIKTEAEGRVYDFNEGNNKVLSRIFRSTSSDTVSHNYIHYVPTTQYDPYYFTHEIRDVLSGTYDVCIVMLPKTVYNPNYDPVADKKQFRPNKFTAEIFYTGLDGKEYSVSSSNRYIYDESLPGFYERAASNSDTSVPFLFDCDVTPNTASTRAFTNDPYRVDTVKLATIHFPTCNFDQTKVTTRVKITNSITNKQTNTYNAEMLVDCILFLPHKETEE